MLFYLVMINESYCMLFMDVKKCYFVNVTVKDILRSLIVMVLMFFVYVVFPLSAPGKVLKDFNYLLFNALSELLLRIVSDCCNC